MSCLRFLVSFDLIWYKTERCTTGKNQVIKEEQKEIQPHKYAPHTILSLRRNSLQSGQIFHAHSYYVPNVRPTIIKLKKEVGVLLLILIQKLCVLTE